MEKLESSHYVNGDAKCYSQFGKQSDPQKATHELPYNPAVLLLDTNFYPGARKMCVPVKTCT